MDKDAKESRDRRIFDMWLACHTQQEIADAVGCTQQTVVDQLKVLPKQFLETKSVKVASDHATDFTPPIYNVWKQQDKTAGASHFGNSEVGITKQAVDLVCQEMADLPKLDKPSRAAAAVEGSAAQDGRPAVLLALTKPRRCLSLAGLRSLSLLRPGLRPSRLQSMDRNTGWLGRRCGVLCELPGLQRRAASGTLETSRHRV